MNKLLLILLFFIFRLGVGQETNQYMTRQGKVSFFSYTTVEHIEATNNQVLSIIDLSKKEIAVSMLMRAFVFKKTLMHEHFNESYIESDRYPKATFEGSMVNFDPLLDTMQTVIAKGVLTLHGVSRNIEIKIKVDKTGDGYVFSGEFNAEVKDYDIKIPPVLAGNIAETISVTFRFEYKPYEN